MLLQNVSALLPKLNCLYKFIPLTKRCINTVLISFLPRVVPKQTLVCETLNYAVLNFRFQKIVQNLKKIKIEKCVFGLRFTEIVSYSRERVNTAPVDCLCSLFASATS